MNVSLNYYRLRPVSLNSDTPPLTTDCIVYLNRVSWRLCVAYPTLSPAMKCCCVVFVHAVRLPWFWLSSPQVARSRCCHPQRKNLPDANESIITEKWSSMRAAIVRQVRRPLRYYRCHSLESSPHVTTVNPPYGTCIRRTSYHTFSVAMDSRSERRLLIRHHLWCLWLVARRRPCRTSEPEGGSVVGQTTKLTGPRSRSKRTLNMWIESYH